MKLKKILKVASVILLSAFGILTVFLTSSVLLDLFGIRAKEGNYVPFIVWINLVAGIGYIYSAFLILKSNPRATLILIGTSIIVLIGIIALHFHINSGGVYKMETVYGMRFRLIVTSVFTILSYLIFKNNTHEKV